MSQQDPIHSLFAGSFDPPTLGHLAIAAEALMGADELTILVAANPAKAGSQMFTPEERIQLFRNSIAYYVAQHAGKNDGTVACKIADALQNGEKKINVITSGGLTIDTAHTIGAGKLVRGLRPNGKDLDDENTLAYINHILVQNRQLPITTVMVAAPDPDHNFVSSSSAKMMQKVTGNGDDLTDYVAPDVLAAMEQRKADMAALAAQKAAGEKEPTNQPSPITLSAQYETPEHTTASAPIVGFMPGDFSLFTNAHRDVAMRALAGLDKLVIGVHSKAGNEYFTPAKRVAFIEQSIAAFTQEAENSNDPVLKKVATSLRNGSKSIEVVSYDKPFLFAAQEHGASIITRGLQPAINRLTSETSMAQITRIEANANQIPVSTEHVTTPVALYQQLGTKDVAEALTTYGAESASAQKLLPEPVRAAWLEQQRANARIGGGGTIWVQKPTEGRST